MTQPPSYINQLTPTPATLQDDEAAAKACAMSLMSLHDAPTGEVLPLDSSALETSQGLPPNEAITTGTNGQTVAIPPPSPGQLSTDAKVAPGVPDISLETTDLVVQPSKAAEHILGDPHTVGDCHPALTPEAISLTKDDEGLDVASDDDLVKSEGDSSCKHIVPEVIDLTGGDELEVVSGDRPVESQDNSQHQALDPEVIDLTQDDNELEEILVPRKSLKRKRGPSVQ